MTTILRTSHLTLGKKITIFFCVGEKGTEVSLNYEDHTHTQGKSHMISENYLIEPQLASHISVTLRGPMMAFLVLHPHTVFQPDC